MTWDDEDFRVVLGSTEVVFDEEKEQLNTTNHGYSLESAVYFLSRYALPIQQPPFITRESQSDHGETRHEHMTVDDDGRVVLFVTTMRDDEEIRIISLRRASSKEREVFRYYTGYGN